MFDVQPSNSPDLNKLNLCFFYSLQQAANKIKGTSKSLTDLVAAVTSAYRDYSVDQLHRVHALTYVVLIAKFMKILGPTSMIRPIRGSVIGRRSYRH